MSAPCYEADDYLTMEEPWPAPSMPQASQISISEQIALLLNIIRTIFCYQCSEREFCPCFTSLICGFQSKVLLLVLKSNVRYALSHLSSTSHCQANSNLRPRISPSKHRFQVDTRKISLLTGTLCSCDNPREGDAREKYAPTAHTADFLSGLRAGTRRAGEGRGQKSPGFH